MATKKTTLPLLTQNITVTPGSAEAAIELTIAVKFDPKAIGEERTQRIWEGVGKMISGLLTPAEQEKFVARLRSEGNKLTKSGAR